MVVQIRNKIKKPLTKPQNATRAMIQLSVSTKDRIATVAITNQLINRKMGNLEIVDLKTTNLLIFASVQFILAEQAPLASSRDTNHF